MNCYKCATPLPDDARFCLSCGADVSGEHTAERTLQVEADPELLAKLQTELGSDFVVEKELGRGGMAIVFLGRDTHLGRNVAIKLLPPELTFASGPGIIERFKREARTAATLDHQHIIPVYRVSTGGKLFWYVMKYLQGEALDDILKREGQLAVDRAVEIVGQVAEALDYAHQNKVVHRDVKPANVMLDARGWVTVTDFGIAKALDTSALTGSGAMIGTPYYMSPEQCSGKPVTGASDQYSLAVMTYQMLGGHLPFTGESVVDIVRKHVMDPPPPLGVLRPQLTPDLVAVVERGLAKTAEERFASCGEFAHALATAAQGLHAAAAPPDQAAVAPGPRVSQTAFVSPVPGALRTARGTWKKYRVLLAATGTLVAAGAVGVSLWPKRERPGDAGRAVLIGAAPAAAPGAPAAPDTLRRDSALPTVAAAPAVATPAAPARGAPDTAGSAAAQPARLTLRGLPPGAAVYRDGQLMRGPSFELPLGRRSVVDVSATGFEPWRQSFTPRAGQRLTQTVSMRPVQTATGQPPAQAQPPAQPQPQAQAAPQPQVVAPQPAARPSVGWISVGTNPRSTIYVNGVAAPRYPLVNFEVPAGRVTLRFQVADSTGMWWARDAVRTVNPGDTVRFGIVRLERP